MKERYAYPILKAIAAWETENGTVCGMLPEQYESFIKVVERACLGQGSARAALDDALTVYPVGLDGMTMIDHPTHVSFNEDETRYAVLISTIFDNGKRVGPENTEAVAPNIATAQRYVENRFNTAHMRTERVDDDPLSSYRLFFKGEMESNMTIWLHLIPFEPAA